MFNNEIVRVNGMFGCDGMVQAIAVFILIRRPAFQEKCKAKNLHHILRLSGDELPPYLLEGLALDVRHGVSGTHLRVRRNSTTYWYRI